MFEVLYFTDRYTITDRATPRRKTLFYLIQLYLPNPEGLLRVVREAFLLPIQGKVYTAHDYLMIDNVHKPLEYFMREVDGADVSSYREGIHKDH